MYISFLCCTFNEPKSTADRRISSSNTSRKFADKESGMMRCNPCSAASGRRAWSSIGKPFCVNPVIVNTQCSTRLCILRYGRMGFTNNYYGNLVFKSNNGQTKKCTVQIHPSGKYVTLAIQSRFRV